MCRTLDRTFRALADRAVRLLFVKLLGNIIMIDSYSIDLFRGSPHHVKFGAECFHIQLQGLQVRLLEE